MHLPKCDYCLMTAQYDFVDNEGEWRYGCTGCWMKHRASRQIGPGHARHLTAGENPPRRPEGYVPKPVDPSKLVKPKLAASVLAYTEQKPKTMRVSAAEVAEKRARTRGPKEFHDMQPQDIPIKEPRPGSVMAITLDLIKEKGGATLEEIQAAIGPKHDALKLLQWMNENRGHGWRKDQEGKIHVVYYQSSSS